MLGLRYLCTITKDHNDRDYEEYSKLLKKAERNLQLLKEQQQQQQHAHHQSANGGYIRGENVVAEQYHEDDRDSQQGVRAPDVSPGSTQRHLQHNPQRNVANLADGYRPELAPQKQGPTFGVGQGNNDEWGDGLGDELLP